MFRYAEGSGSTHVSIIKNVVISLNIGIFDLGVSTHIVNLRYVVWMYSL